MTELVRFPRSAPARAFARVLEEHGVPARVEPREQEYAVDLSAPEHEDEARVLLERFLANPDDPRFRHNHWQISEPAGASPDQPPIFSGNWLASMGLVTKAVLFLCVGIFFLGSMGQTGLYEALMFPEDWRALMEQPWRLLTPMLLHFNLLHIIFNMLWWSELGRIVEDFQSSPQLVWVTLFTGITANLAQYIATGPRFGGMSGVVYGLLGYLWIYGKANPGAGYGLRREIVILMVGWLILCFVALDEIVANQAHLFGLLSGCLLGGVTGLWRRWRYYS